VFLGAAFSRVRYAKELEREKRLFTLVRLINTPSGPIRVLVCNWFRGQTEFDVLSPRSNGPASKQSGWNQKHWTGAAAVESDSRLLGKPMDYYCYAYEVDIGFFN